MILTHHEQTDPFQLNNIYPTSNSANLKLLGRPISQLTSRLDTLLLVLKSCKGDTCIDPWNVLHPDGSVKNLQDAVSVTYDSLYHEQPKVGFNRCEDGYIIGAEGPQSPLVLASTHRDGLSWDSWV